jgi:GNAT superfamily N-acetyltransferase
MPTFVIRPLEPSTWPDFAGLVERHNGVWGGCWCLEFHPEGAERGAHRRQRKECRVRDGSTHAALVYSGDACLGWCQFGSPDELPRIKHQRPYRAVHSQPPDWRITCFFVDKAHRRKGVAQAALAGAMQDIARTGGGIVESYPEELSGRSVSSAFLYNGSVSMFDKLGFARVRRLGKNHWVVARVVEPERR